MEHSKNRLIDLSKLYHAQAELDAAIQQKHKVNYESTRQKRLLALLVEVGELINETRTFKFWSLKGPASSEVILDEYADGIHFFLSLGIDIQSEKKVYELVKSDTSLTEQTMKIYACIIQFAQTFTIADFELAFSAYLNLMLSLGFDSEQVIEGYFKKLGVNYTRQDQSY
jgi:dimeric dUTPase (all-alpha-NTP-PPase superfamily)